MAHGCRKRKKLVCGPEEETVVAHGRLPSPAPHIIYRSPPISSTPLLLPYHLPFFFSHIIYPSPPPISSTPSPPPISSTLLLLPYHLPHLLLPYHLPFSFSHIIYPSPPPPSFLFCSLLGLMFIQRNEV